MRVCDRLRADSRLGFNFVVAATASIVNAAHARPSSGLKCFTSSYHGNEVDGLPRGSSVRRVRVSISQRIIWRAYICNGITLTTSRAMSVPFAGETACWDARRLTCVCAGRGRCPFHSRATWLAVVATALTKIMKKFCRKAVRNP